jgi:hypothetical protein
LLEFSPQINAEWVVPTEYPAMYFDGPKIKSTVDCEILSLRGGLSGQELVGINMTYGTDRVTKKIMQNTFSPVFGPEAGRLLIKK